MRKGSKLGIIVPSLLFVYVGVAIYADTQVSVYIRDPLNSSNNTEGLISGNCWVAEITITVSGGRNCIWT